MKELSFFYKLLVWRINTYTFGGELKERGIERFAKNDYTLASCKSLHGTISAQ
jgi:hypothetical protein